VAAEASEEVAKDSASAPVTPEADVSEAGSSDSEDSGERKSRRRRKKASDSNSSDKSKARGGRGARTSKNASDGDSREFWEAWADEKQARDGDGDGDVEAEADAVVNDDDAVKAEASSDGDAAPEETKKASGVRLYVNIGKREELSADEVRDLLADGVSDEDAERIGSVSLRNTHSYVRVPEEIVDGLIAAASGKSVGERELVVERAKRESRRSPRNRR